jgi:thiol-disulfide isomerase/thioredoxin
MSTFPVRLAACLVLVVLGSRAVTAPPTSSTETVPTPPPAPVGVEIKTVSYKDLGAAIRSQQGKVVMVDVWATWCPPCVKNFPHLVELHKKYGKDGLVCISVSLDKPDASEKALTFLKKQDAAFSNFLLDEKAEVWQEKWDVSGPPIYFVFDKTGRRAAKFDTSDADHPINFDEIEKLVQKLLKEGK